MNKVSFLFVQRYVHTHTCVSTEQASQIMDQYAEALKRMKGPGDAGSCIQLFDSDDNMVLAIPTRSVLMAWRHD